MLQIENEKADKKINQTSKKADELISLRHNNDLKLIKEEDEAAEREEKRNQGRQNFHMEERKRKQSVEQARLSMYAQNKRIVQSVRS